MSTGNMPGGKGVRITSVGWQVTLCVSGLMSALEVC